METLEVTGSAQLPYPRELREMHGQGCKARELEVLPKHLLRFLHQDLNKVREKHFQGTTGEAWLLAASYVDPRFRGHSMWEKMSKKEVKEMICKMVVESHEKYPELRERLRKAAEDPMNHKLETLGRPEPKKTRGRGRGRGRGAGRQEKPKSTSEAILRDSACAAASGPAVRLQPGPRALKERTSAEDWLFGPQPDRRPAAEVAVLDDLKEVTGSALSAFPASSLIIFRGKMRFPLSKKSIFTRKPPMTPPSLNAFLTRKKKNICS